jgi:hypothetical protein
MLFYHSITQFRFTALTIHEKITVLDIPQLPCAGESLNLVRIVKIQQKFSFSNNGDRVFYL